MDFQLPRISSPPGVAKTNYWELCLVKIQRAGELIGFPASPAHLSPRVPNKNLWRNIPNSNTNSWRIKWISSFPRLSPQLPPDLPQKCQRKHRWEIIFNYDTKSLENYMDFKPPLALLSSTGPAPPQKCQKHTSGELFLITMQKV